MSPEERKAIAETILQQLGGSNRLAAMIGATNFSYGSKGELTFHFKMCKKANIIKITLNGLDLYDITFMKYNRKTYEVKEVETITNVYNDTLKSFIEDFTGLYLAL